MVGTVCLGMSSRYISVLKYYNMTHMAHIGRKLVLRSYLLMMYTLVIMTALDIHDNNNCMTLAYIDMSHV